MDAVRGDLEVAAVTVFSVKDIAEGGMEPLEAFLGA